MCFTVKERVGDQYLGCKRTPQSAEQMPRTPTEKASRCISKLLGECEVFASALIRRLVRGWQSIASSQQTVSNIQFYFTRNTRCKNIVATQHFQHTVTTFLLSSLIGSGDFWRIRGHARSVFNRIWRTSKTLLQGQGRLVAHDVTGQDWSKVDLAKWVWVCLLQCRPWSLTIG